MVRVAGVAQFTATAVSAVVSGVAPVASHTVGPDAEFSVNFALGYMAPTLAVLRIHNTADTLEPVAMTPDAFGFPATVSNDTIG